MKIGSFTFHIPIFLALTLFVLFPLLAENSNAATLSLYKNCVYGDDFGDGTSENINVTPVGDLCNDLCNRECNALSRKDGNLELNGDKILACMRSCKSGEIYSTSSLQISPGVTDGRRYSTGSHCSKSSSSKLFYHYPHDSKVVVNKDEQIIIKIRGTTNAFGGISMCGAQFATLKPATKAMDFPTMDADWDRLKNGFSSDIASWHARNPNVTRTGIIFKDGDYLKIEITGDYRFKCSGTGKYCNPHPDDHSLRFRKAGVYNFGLNYSDSNFERLPGGDLQSYTRNSDGSITGFEQAFQANKSVIWKGLQGRLNIGYSDDTESDPPVVDTVGKKVTTFEGVVEDFSDSYNHLGLLHYDDATAVNWDNNLGGLEVAITKLGCLFTDGDRLQYAITEELPGIERDTPLEDSFKLPEIGDWKDVPKSSSLDHNSFPSPKTGKIWLRIKPLNVNEDAKYYPNCSVTDPDCLFIQGSIPSMYGPGSTSGEYFVEVRRVQSDAFGSSILSDTIRDIRTYFFGENGGGGIVQDMFNKFVANSQLVQMIRALLVLFITLTGVSYVIGVAKITQRDAVVRLISVGLVVALLAPNSWEFFNTYLFQLFINGGLELMANVVNYTEYGLPIDAFQRVQDDPALVFTVLDKPLAILFGAKTWLKIYALVFSSSVGWLIALAVCYAGVIYAITLIKAMLIYVVSLIFMAILLLLAPVFISFVLFQYTRKMFITWLQQLMSVTLQPVVIVAGLGIFSTLILAGIYTALGFTVCEGCFFNFYFPFIMDEPFCWWPAWFTLLSKHGPDGVVMPPLIGVGAAFYFLIMAQGAYVFCTNIVKRINQIISGFFLGVDLSGYSNLSDYTSTYVRSAAAAPGYALGTDAAAQGARANLRSTFGGEYQRDKSGKITGVSGGSIFGKFGTFKRQAEKGFNNQINKDKK